MANSEFKVGMESLHPEKNYFLLTGLARSGTTLLTHILSQHPEISMLSQPHIQKIEQNFTGEKADLYEFMNYLVSELTKTPYVGIAEKSAMFIHGGLEGIMQYLAKRIVLVVRDPRDSLASANEVWFNEQSPKRHYEKEEYLPILRELISWCDEKSKNGIPIKIVKYEDLIRNPLGVLTEIVTFIGCSVEDIQLVLNSAEDTAFESRGDMKLKERGGAIHDHSIGKWKKELTPEDIRYVESQFEDILTRFSY